MQHIRLVNRLKSYGLKVSHKQLSNNTIFPGESIPGDVIYECKGQALKLTWRTESKDAYFLKLTSLDDVPVNAPLVNVTLISKWLAGKIKYEA